MSPYFKIHLKERYTWVMCRFYFSRKRPTLWVPVPVDDAEPLANQLPLISPQAGWACVSLTTPKDVEGLGDLLRKAYDLQKASRTKAVESGERTAALTIEVTPPATPTAD